MKWQITNYLWWVRKHTWKVIWCLKRPCGPDPRDIESYRLPNGRQKTFKTRQEAKDFLDGMF